MTPRPKRVKENNGERERTRSREREKEKEKERKARCFREKERKPNSVIALPRFKWNAMQNEFSKLMGSVFPLVNRVWHWYYCTN